MVVFDDLQQEVEEISKAEQAEGKLHKQYEEDKLMNSVLQGDKKTMEHAELIQEATNRSVGSFTPDLLFASLTKNFSIAQQLLGDKMIKLLTGYNPNYVEKNLHIPEFKKELKQKIEQNIGALKDDKLVDKEGMISQSGAALGAMVLMKELDNYITKDSMGEKVNKKAKHYGDKGEPRLYRLGDRYKDLHLKRTIRLAIRRQHTTLDKKDLVTAQREGRGKLSMIFALDASSSMKGKKIEMCKKAGIALAYKAINAKDTVGLVAFGSDIKNAIAPTQDFSQLLNAISTIKASRQTDFVGMIQKCTELFPATAETKHLIILTDAMPTVGDEPEKDTLQAVSQAKSAGITISLIGVQMEHSGVELAKQITTLGEGRLSLVKDLDQIGNIVLEDYYSAR